MHGELREVAWQMLAGPASTKHVLEDTFAWLHDAVQRGTTNAKMAPWTKYFYTVQSPYIAQAGMKTLDLRELTFSMLNTAMPQVRKAMQNLLNSQSIFNVKRTNFSADLPRPRDIHTVWRKAGFHANRKSAAAAAFLLWGDLDRVADSWAGAMVVF